MVLKNTPLNCEFITMLFQVPVYMTFIILKTADLF